MRPNEVNGTTYIKFRISKAIDSLITEASKKAGISKSEFVRGIIYYYLASTLLETLKGSNVKTLNQIREELKEVFK